MTSPHQREYLSFGDALFLHLEHEGAPLNIASLAIFEGHISFNDLSGFVASKLPHIPRYMQRVVVPPLSIGLPHWEFAPGFDLNNHLHEIRLKHGTDAELKKAAARILSPTMDRRNPLWDLTLIHGIKGNRTGLLARMHHCLADGISGVGILNILMDAEPKATKVTKRKVRVPPPPLRAPGADIFDAAIQSWFSGVDRILTAAGELVTMAQRSVLKSPNGLSPNAPELASSNGSSGGADMAQLLSELTVLPDRLPFNVLCRGPQRFEWTEVSLSELKAIKYKGGTSVNDVVLTILTSAFRRYSELLGVNVRGRSLRIIVPVSMPRPHNHSDLGNHITFAPVSTPLGVRNPRKLLATVHQRMQFVKTEHVADVVAFAGTLMGIIPSPLQAMLAPVVSQLPISLCNTICTNVPGPSTPLYLMGHEMLRAYPYVPIGGEMGLNCAVLSYQDTVCFGFTGDMHAAPDLQRFPALVNASMAELKNAFGILTSQPAGRRTKRSRVAKSKVAAANVEPPVRAEHENTSSPEVLETAVGAGSRAA